MKNSVKFDFLLAKCHNKDKKPAYRDIDLRVCVCVCVSIYVTYTELIEETRRPPGLILASGGNFAWLGQVRVLDKIHTFDGVMT